jgi:hypothetical protein
LTHPHRAALWLNRDIGAQASDRGFLDKRASAVLHASPRLSVVVMERNEAAMRLYRRTNLIIIDCDSNARKGQRPMKFMIIVKASKASEAGEMPSTELLTAMGNYNEELSKAGILLAGEGLHPSSKGVRVRFSGKDRTVTDGPFAETKELIAGYWLWEVGSLQEAIDWVKRCPQPA